GSIENTTPKIDAMLSPLGYYGGTTQTMPPKPGSPAIDAGSNALIASGVLTDQRGGPRIAGAQVDIGSVETDAPTRPPPPPPPPSGGGTGGNTGGGTGGDGDHQDKDKKHPEKDAKAREKEKAKKHKK